MEYWKYTLTSILSLRERKANIQYQNQRPTLNAEPSFVPQTRGYGATGAQCPMGTESADSVSKIELTPSIPCPGIPYRQRCAERRRGRSNVRLRGARDRSRRISRPRSRFFRSRRIEGRV